MGITMSADGISTKHDRRAAVALVLAVLALATSLTFFWVYGLPPLLFAIPAAMLLRRVAAERQALGRSGATAAALIGVAILCDLVFLLKNIHHLY